MPAFMSAAVAATFTAKRRVRSLATLPVNWCQNPESHYCTMVGLHLVAQGRVQQLGHVAGQGTDDLCAVLRRSDDGAAGGPVAGTRAADTLRTSGHTIACTPRATHGACTVARERCGCYSTACMPWRLVLISWAAQFWSCSSRFAGSKPASPVLPLCCPAARATISKPAYVCNSQLTGVPGNIMIKEQGLTDRHRRGARATPGWPGWAWRPGGPLQRCAAAGPRAWPCTPAPPSAMAECTPVSPGISPCCAQCDCTAAGWDPGAPQWRSACGEPNKLLRLSRTGCSACAASSYAVWVEIYTWNNNGVSHQLVGAAQSRRPCFEGQTTELACQGSM
jgi:hypothetical protein